MHLLSLANIYLFNDINEVILVSLLLTLNLFHTFLCFYSRLLTGNCLLWLGQHLLISVTKGNHQGKLHSEAVTRKCSITTLFWRNSQNSQEDTHNGKLFSCKSREIFQVSYSVGQFMCFENNLENWIFDAFSYFNQIHQNFECQNPSPHVKKSQSLQCIRFRLNHYDAIDQSYWIYYYWHVWE